MPAPKTDSQQTRAHAKISSRNVFSGQQGASAASLPPLESQEGLASRPAFMKDPPPGRALSTENLSPKPRPITGVELPRLVAEVGRETAIEDSLWTEGPGLMASVLATNIPVSLAQVDVEELRVDTAKDVASLKKTTDRQNKEPKQRAKNISKHKQPLTGTDVMEIFAKQKHLGKLQFFHLKPVDGGAYRPYDLRVVPQSKAGMEFYIFSSTSVLHVRDGCSAGFLSLAEWNHEAVLWNALQNIPFFRDYLLKKAFARWQRNVSRIALKRRCEVLQGQLLTTVPQLREALFHFCRLIEELKEVHWLPQDESKTYTLLDFQNTLLKKNQECRGLLERFLQYRALILNTVQEDGYRAQQELQQRLELAQVNQNSQPLHLQLSLVQDLKKKLRQAEDILKKLGNMAALVDQMIVQSLVTITQQECLSFLNNVLKPQQGCLFEAKLIFGADGQLTLFPPMHLFREVVSGALLSVADSALQVFDAYSYSPESKDCVTACNPPIRAAPELSPDLSLPCSSSKPGHTGPKAREQTEISSLSSRREPPVELTSRLVLPRLNPLKVQGTRLRGQYYPLCKNHLEWQLQLHSRATEVQEELDRITQEAQQELQKLCDEYVWLVDIHLFTSQWSPASLEAMRGQPALIYDEHIQKVRFWMDRLSTMPCSFTTSNKLLIIHCAHIQEKLGPVLASIEEDVLAFLVGELKLRSQNLIQELRKSVDGLRVEPTDLNDFTQYTSMVTRCENMSSDMQQQLEYMDSLQKTVRMNYRQEEALEALAALDEQMVDLWDCFGPLLKQAAETVQQRLPSMADTLNSTFSSLAQDLEDTISTATSGPFLDPTQNASQILTQLKTVSRHVNALSARLQELSRISRSLRGHPLDLTFVTTGQQKILTRKELWELLSFSTAQIREWRQLPFSKFLVLRAQGKVDEWLQQGMSLARLIPSQDAVLQQTLQTLEHFNLQLPVLALLSSPTLKHKHWRNIFKGIGQLYTPLWSLTVADLMSKMLVEHQNIISKICWEAKAEADMEQAFRKLQRRWEGTQFRLAKFIVTVGQEDRPQDGAAHRNKPDLVSNHASPQHCGTFTIIGLETLLAQTEDSVMTLSSMLLSPYVAEFRQEAEHWVQLLQELEELLDFCERYQKKWIFLSKMFYETTLREQKSELFETFQPVDESFRELIQTTSSDPHVLNIVRAKKVTESNVLFYGDGLRRLLMAGLSTMEGISNQLLYLLDSPRGQFPRLYFLSDGEVIRLLSLHPTPSALLPLVRKCFRGACWLEVVNSSNLSQDVTELRRGLDLSDSQMLVQGVYGSLREHVSFLCPLEPNLNSLAWMGQLEQQLFLAMRELVKQCAVALVEPSDKELETDRKTTDTSLTQSDFLRKKEIEGKKREDDLPSLESILLDYPLQCELLVGEARWFSEVKKAAAQVKWNHMKSRNTSKLHSLCQTVRNSLSCATDRSLSSQRAMTVLRSLVLQTMNHAQNISRLMELEGDLESSFEWQSLMKYHVVLDCGDETRQSPDNKDCLCYVEVLGAQLPYGYEYLGPDQWLMVNSPSTDRAILGILLALTAYRCGFVSGPQMSGKKRTVVQLGKALGRQVISFHCCENTRISIIQQFLVGALQTGAWLVLDSVDSLTQGALSLLGQHLSDIHQSLSCLQRIAQPKGLESCTEPSSPSSVPNREQTSSPQEGRNLGRGCEKMDDLEMCFAGKSIFVKQSYGCVIISSRGYSVDIPENLRAATRPVALAHPDYRVIAEAMLTSLGFSDAVMLSRSLLSLFTLASKCLCLPASVSGKQTSWLVLLMNVITAAGLHLQSTRRQEVQLKEMELEDQADVDRHSSDVVLKMTESEETAKEGKRFNIKRSNQSSVLIQGVVEEQAIVKGVTSVLVSAFHEGKKASQFRALFEEIFPTVRSYPVQEMDIEEGDRNLLKCAVMEELQQGGLHADTRVLREVLSLYQAMKLSRAVLMVGSSGSGKTTCYHALAGALRKLAARAEEMDLDDDVSPHGRCSEKDYSPTTSNWYSVDTVVIFPNALSNEELFGGYFQQHEGYWSDGVFTKVLKDSEGRDFIDSSPCKRKKRRSSTRKVKWLVMDGEPLGQPGWLDHLSTLCDPDNPSLCLPSAEKIRPSVQELKLLAEVTDLSDAAPSTVTRCTLVHLSGKDLWKSVWKVEVDALSRDHTLDQGTINMWVRLAEDLFSRTLTFLRHKALTPVMHGESDNDNKVGIAYGLQEVMSFIRILHALLEQCGKGHRLKASRQPDTAPVEPQASTVDISTPSSQLDLQSRNIFLVAYIWGFGGHLHPRHWPQFDVLVREALFESRYRVEVPAEGTVFEYFFNTTEGMMGDVRTPINCSRNQSPQMTYIPIPQYQKYVCLLDLMLEAHQPVMLVGEVGSGKTMLCESLMNEDRPHVRLIAGPRLHASGLRGVLENMGQQKTLMGAMGTPKKQTRNLLFVDDLHRAPCDVYGKTSMALETLRQCISRGGVSTSDGYHFKLFSSGAVYYLGTCSTSSVTEPRSNSISSRLSRLFSIVVLPSLSVDVLFSVHSPLIQTWLREFQGMQRYTDMTRSIITATLDLYQSVREHFLPNPQRPHFLFSHHDLQKVFQGMCLWAPRASDRNPPQRKGSLRSMLSSSALPCFSPTMLGLAANVLNIVRLWMHECLRTFGDRLCSEDENQTLVSLISQVSDNSYSSWMTGETQAVGGKETSSSTTPPTCAFSSVTEDPPASPHQAPASPSQTERDAEALAFTQPTQSPLPGEVNEEEERQEVQQEPIRTSSSASSLSDNEKEDLFDQKEKLGISKEEKRPTPPLHDTASSSPQCLSPSPPKGPKPAGQSDRKRSLRLSEPSTQDDSIHGPGPGSARLIPLQLLQDLNASMCNLVYGPELFEPLTSTVQQHNFKHNVSYQERDLGLLLQQLVVTVKSKEQGEDEYIEDKSSCVSSYVVHRQRVRQLLHILRALFIPGGHGVLFSMVKGTGRRTTVRLAAYLAGYQLMEVHPGNQRTLRYLLKEASSQAGVQGNSVMILVHEETSQEHREELLEVMASGTFPGLYSDEELKNLVLKVNAVIKNSRSRLRDAQALDKYFRQVQKNVHVFLLLPLSEADATSVTRVHVSRAVSLCCCVEVYQPWSRQTLIETASRHLKENLKIPCTAIDRDSLVASLSKVMAEIHQSAWKYAFVLLPDLQPFSPQTYLELIAHFFHLCSHLSKQGLGQATRVATVLARVKDMTDTAEGYKQEVIRLQNKLAEKQQCLHQLQHEIQMEQVLCDRSRQSCLLEENRLSHLEEQLQQAQQQADDTFKEVSPLYQTALLALKSLSQTDLDEVRHYRVPPAGVVIIMDAICMLFGYPCTWESAKHLLGQSNFRQELEFYDRSRLNGEMFEQLGHIIQRKGFSPQAVKSVSRACESLCRWVLAVYQYACVQRQMAPQEVKKIQLEFHMAESRSRLSVARLQEEERRENIDGMEKELLLLRGEHEVLAGLLRKAEALEKEASSAVQQVECHITDWKAAAEETEMNNQTIPGDALLLASAITYLGPFRPDTRMELLQKWRELSLTGSISGTPDDPRTSLLPQSSPEPPPPPLDHVSLPMAAELHTALTRALGVDRYMVQGVPPGLLLKLLTWGNRGPWAQRWPLLADASQREEISSQTMLFTGNLPEEDSMVQEEREYELVLSADDPGLMDKVCQGAEKGWRVLVRHIERAAHTPDFLDLLVRQAGHCTPGLKRPIHPAHPEYCLFLSTCLPVRLLLNEIHPSVLSEVRIIDLSLSKTEVQELLLTELVQLKCPELVVQYCSLIQDRHTLHNKLAQEEVSLMEYILQSFTPLLQDPQFLPRASACQLASLRLQAELADLSQELVHHQPLLADFQRVAALATSLYQALQEVACLSPAYYFPLKTFLLNMRGALALKGKRDVVFSREMLTGAVMAEITHRMVSHFLTQYRPCLFQSHASLLRLLVSLALCLHSEPCSEVERVAFLEGLGDMDLPTGSSTQTAAPPSLSSPSTLQPELPCWLPSHTHTGVLRLENIPSFRGLIASLAASPEQWKEYFRFPSSTLVGPIPCRSLSHLSTLQRALLWKTLLPHWLAAVAEDLAACHLGQPVCSALPDSPHTGSPEALSRFLSRHKGPVIITLPCPEREGPASIQPLHWLKQVAQYQADRNGVTVKIISVGATCQKETILSSLALAVCDGHWLVFNNCHLLEQWDAEIVTEFNQLISVAAKIHQTDVGSEEGPLPAGPSSSSQVDPRFRLWFITRGYRPLSIPSVVRACALRLVCDSPWDVKEELCSSLHQVVSEAVPASASAVSASSLEPLLRCAVLHAVLLQRQAYKHLGQGSIYQWTQEDLKALLDAYAQIATHCDDKTRALEYIAAQLVYGGHVADSADMEAVERTARACFQPASPLWGCGPHTLSDIMHIHGRFDVAGLLKGLEHRVRALANTRDPLLLGFSTGLSVELVKVHSHTLNLLLLDSQRPTGRMWSITRDFPHPALLPDLSQARDRLQTLKDSLGPKEKSWVVGLSQGPLHSFLLAEWEDLRDLVSSLLSELNQLHRSRTPSSFPNLTTLSHLEKRAELLSTYLWKNITSGPPSTYCLSAFSNARGFLAALVREAAKAKQRKIIDFSLHFQVLSAASCPSAPPLTGVYLRGLELRGALWDTRLGALQDTLSPKPCLLPLLWVRARARDTDVRAPDGFPCTTSCLPLYHCPLYLDGERHHEVWGLTENNIITHVPLVAKLDPVLCSLRRVRLVSILLRSDHS